MHKKHAAKGLAVVSISNDKTVQEAGAFARDMKTTFPVLHDPKDALYKRFGVEFAGTNILLDRSGKVIFVQTQPNVKALEAAVAKAMGGK